MDENPSIDVEYDLNRICRSCLNECDNLSSVFDIIAFNNSQPLNEKIMAVAQVQVVEDDGMPQKICENCTRQVHNAYDFKLKCEQSDSALREYILKKDPNNKIKILSAIKQEDEFHLSIKPEISIVEDDPLNEDFYNMTSRNVKKTALQIDDDDQDPEDNDCLKDDPDYSEENINYKAARNEQGRYNCHICEKTLADAKGLKLHIRLHTGQNLKRCSVCNRGFAKKNHLTRHMDTHKEKVITCVHCDDTFTSNHDLKIHLTLNNVSRKRGRTIKKEPIIESDSGDEGEDTKEKVGACKICDSTFNKISILRTHLQTHSNIESFNNIDLQSKLFLFDLTKITPSLENNQELTKYIMKDIQEGMFSRFYQITNQSGYEYNLSDSETESESEDMPVEMFTDKKPNIAGQHACVNCDKIFDRSYKINQHMKFEHPENEFLFPCGYCQRYFSTEWLLAKHLRSQCDNKFKQYSCSACKIKFMWQTSYEKHNEKFHSGKRVKKTKTKNKSRDRQIKEKPKEKNFICQVCSKAFFRQEHLDRHVKIHIPSERKFECTICEKKFNRKDNLRSHMRVHKEEKEDCDKHLCVYCGRSFSNSSNLIVHMRRHTGEKPYKCDLCDKGFPRSSDLQCHRRTHTGEKPCLCTICGKGFSRSNKLVRHMRIHTGIRPYKCTHCDRAFTQSNDLTLHIRRHTGEKPYVCGICGDRFIQGTALQTHRRMQGHYEEVNQPAPFASISVNNPNRFTNANRVNRIGISAANISNEIKQTIVKQDISSPTPDSSIQSSATGAATTTVAPTNSSASRLLPGFGMHGAYVPNGVPFLSNSGVLMQNLEVSTTIFSISAYNQGFN